MSVKFPKAYAMDIEDGGKGPDSFLIGIAVSDCGIVKQFKTVDEMRLWLLGLNHDNQAVDVWAYNVSYELGHLFGALSGPQVSDKYGTDFTFISSKAALLGCRINNKGCAIRVKDLSRYAPGGLDKVGKLFGMKKTGCKCDGTIRASREGLPRLRYDGTCPWCGMYNVRAHKGMTSLKQMNPRQRNTMIQYCEQDCRITMRGAQSEYESFKAFRCKPSGYSIGHKSLKIFRTNSMEQEGFNKRERQLNDFEQLSFYGGRTETCDSKLFKKVVYVDVNSMYPRQMLKPMPNPDTAELVYDDWDSVKAYPGISLARVSIPEHLRAGLLPVRVDDGICYPVGLFSGVWPHCELLEAERLGAKIYVKQSIIYEWMSSPFRKFINTFWSIRKKAIAEGDSVTKEQCKLIMNNLFGKFGQKPGGVREIPHTQACFKLGCRCPLSHVNPETMQKFPNIDGVEWIRYMDETGKEPIHRRVIFASYITGYARSMLMPYFLDERVIGGDTDSLFCTAMPDVEIGDELGQFKEERRINFQSIAPKQYNFSVWRCYYCSYSSYEPGTCKDHPDIPLVHKRFHKTKGINRNFTIKLKCSQCGSDYDSDEIMERCPCGGLLGVFGRGERPIKRAESRTRNLPVSSWVEHEKYASGDYSRKVRAPDLRLLPHIIRDERPLISFNAYASALKHGGLYAIRDNRLATIDAVASAEKQ
jgi:hypothetical protein